MLYIYIYIFIFLLGEHLNEKFKGICVVSYARIICAPKNTIWNTFRQAQIAHSGSAHC